MQTKEQIKNWKVVASVATVAALGVSGLAIGSPGNPTDTPSPIEIQDQRTSAETFATTTTLGFVVVPNPSFSHGSLDSPLASASLDSPSPDSPSLDSPTVVSPAPAPAPAPTTAPADDSPSPDSPSPDSPSVDSADSGDSLDS